MINSWLLYKRECVVLGVPKRDVVVRRRFQSALASTLVKANVIPRRRGRSSLEGDDSQDGADANEPQAKKTKLYASKTPTIILNYLYNLINLLFDEKFLVFMYSIRSRSDTSCEEVRIVMYPRYSARWCLLLTLFA